MHLAVHGFVGVLDNLTLEVIVLNKHFYYRLFICTCRRKTVSYSQIHNNIKGAILQKTLISLDCATPYLGLSYQVLGLQVSIILRID